MVPQRDAAAWQTSKLRSQVLYKLGPLLTWRVLRKGFQLSFIQLPSDPGSVEMFNMITGLFANSPQDVRILNPNICRTNFSTVFIILNLFLTPCMCVCARVRVHVCVCVCVLLDIDTGPSTVLHAHLFCIFWDRISLTHWISQSGLKLAILLPLPKWCNFDLCQSAFVYFASFLNMSSQNGLVCS